MKSRVALFKLQKTVYKLEVVAELQLSLLSQHFNVSIWIVCVIPPENVRF
jgi:hypothetical protein